MRFAIGLVIKEVWKSCKSKDGSTTRRTRVWRGSFCLFQTRSHTWPSMLNDLLMTTTWKMSTIRVGKQTRWMWLAPFFQAIQTCRNLLCMYFHSFTIFPFLSSRFSDRPFSKDHRCSGFPPVPQELQKFAWHSPGNGVGLSRTWSKPQGLCWGFVQFSWAANSCQVALDSKCFCIPINSAVQLLSANFQNLFFSEEIQFNIFKAFSGHKQTLEYFSTGYSRGTLSPAAVKNLSRILSANYSLCTCDLIINYDGDAIKFKKIMKRNKALLAANRFKKTKLAAIY